MNLVKILVYKLPNTGTKLQAASNVTRVPTESQHEVFPEKT